MSVTIERELRFLDKTTWGPGQWQDEPDKVQWTDETTGLPCLALRNPHSGHWCGYVGVAEGHPLFGVEYSEADRFSSDDEDDDGFAGFHIHGGLTYSAFCQDDDDAEDHGICHVPQPGAPDRVWWFGFDCAHSGDLSPAIGAGTDMLKIYSDIIERKRSYETYRDLAYVQEQCASLAKQLQAVV